MSALSKVDAMVSKDGKSFCPNRFWEYFDVVNTLMIYMKLDNTLKIKGTHLPTSIAIVMDIGAKRYLIRDRAEFQEKKICITMYQEIQGVAITHSYSCFRC